MLRKMLRNKKGQGLVEYGLIIAGVALVAAAAISMFGHKTTDLIAAVAAVLPGAHADGNAPIVSGKLIELTEYEEGGDAIQLDIDEIAGRSGTPRLGNNVAGSGQGGQNFGGLVVGPPATP
jgi:pilus assembly protein Flp/PilA